MCGRYAVAQSLQTIESQFQATFNYEYKPSYNAAPSQLLPVITSEDRAVIQGLKWGLVPHWSKTEKPAFNTINARGEQVHYTAAYKIPIRQRRCLVIANCYYEWKKEESGKKTPYLIYCQNQRLFAMAGIWDEWENKEQGVKIKSFSVITTQANPRLSAIHDRMPVILPPAFWLEWLNTSTALSLITSLISPYPEEQVNAYPISDRLNSPANNDKDLLQPAGERIYIQPEVTSNGGYKHRRGGE